MKKTITFLTLLLLLGGKLFSQGTPQYASTNPSLKNMVIEEFTGRNCHACPSGHKTANRLLRENPGRLFLINIHEALEPDTYPNLKTEDSDTITKTFGIPFVPSGIVNRNMDVDGISTNWWEGEIYTRSKEIADCNIGGYVVVDEETRKATINVEIYYTSDSNFDDNYLSIAMTQDSIWGSQIDGHENPEQYVDGNYCHMHVLRDIITSTWGDMISPTTAGTLITKTYEYSIPAKIGSPNGVEVDLNNIHFLAFVAENNASGSMSMPILNVCKLKHVEDNVSVKETVETSVNIYPNPVKDVLTIATDNVKQVVMYNSLGQVVKTVRCDDRNISINVSDLENGMYFVNIIDNEGNVATNKVSVLK